MEKGAGACTESNLPIPYRRPESLVSIPGREGRRFAVPPGSNLEKPAVRKQAQDNGGK
jgi:hypothetical protein